MTTRMWLILMKNWTLAGMMYTPRMKVNQCLFFTYKLMLSLICSCICFKILLRVKLYVIFPALLVAIFKCTGMQSIKLHKKNSLQWKTFWYKIPLMFVEHQSTMSYFESLWERSLECRWSEEVDFRWVGGEGILAMCPLCLCLCPNSLHFP